MKSRTTVQHITRDASCINRGLGRRSIADASWLEGSCNCGLAMLERAEHITEVTMRTARITNDHGDRRFENASKGSRIRTVFEVLVYSKLNASLLASCATLRGMTLH